MLKEKNPASHIFTAVEFYGHNKIIIFRSVKMPPKEN